MLKPLRDLQISYAVTVLCPLAFFFTEKQCHPLSLSTNVTKHGHSVSNFEEEVAHTKTPIAISSDVVNSDYTDILQTTNTQDVDKISPVDVTFTYDFSNVNLTIYKDQNESLPVGVSFRNETNSETDDAISNTFSDIACPFANDSLVTYSKLDGSLQIDTSLPNKTVFPSEITYKELISLDDSCDEMHNCKANRPVDVLLRYGCNCESSCIELNTCCIDSPFRKIKPLVSGPHIKCRTVYGGRNLDIFMVDSCKTNWTIGDEIQELCSSDGQDTNDPFLGVPVTSSETNITYKNYFCAVCNDDNYDDNLTFWNIKLTGKDEIVLGPDIPDLIFNSTLNTWMVFGTIPDNNSIAVTFDILLPNNIQSLVKRCTANLVSNCSESWNETIVSEKCSSYMATVFITKNGRSVGYRNPHCVVCNFERIEDVQCSDDKELIIQKQAFLQDVIFVGLFVLEDRKKTCKDNMVYDRLADKCRIIRCPKRKNQVLREGKCVDKET